MNRFGLAVFSLNQLSLDFDGNCQRIIKSIEMAIDAGAAIRVGPELEIPGYGCEDAFYEVDTTLHCWQVLAEIIKRDFRDILIDVGMPVIFNSAQYNCRIVLLNSKIVLIRPKTRLAVNGNYRETRWFNAWDDGSVNHLTWYRLPTMISELTKQELVPFGDGAILEIPIINASGNSMSSTTSVRIGHEICEELWRLGAQHVNLFGWRGCHLILNSSSSYWESRKLNRAFGLIKTASFKSGGVYAFANSVGCDGGGRLCFYGRSLVMKNGELVAMTTDRQTMFDEIQMALAAIDISDVVYYRLQNNIRIDNHKQVGDVMQFDASQGICHQRTGDITNVTTICVEGFDLFKNSIDKRLVTRPAGPFQQLKMDHEEEIVMYCCLWLWDYIRRCPGLRGFIIPLSGGLDSSSVACIVFCLCKLIDEQIKQQNKEVIAKIKSITGEKDIKNLDSAKKICSNLLKCVYLSTRYSGAASRRRSEELAKLINAEFVAFNFDDIFKQIQETVPSSQSKEARSLQQQNVQARLRMVLTYYLSEGHRLVLATGNVDEALVGYLTKYDCSSADLNPIGSISKHDLKQFLKHCVKLMPNDPPGQAHKVITEIVEAIPSAELTGEDQRDEDDLQLTYEELSIIGRTRRGEFGSFGPFGVFCKIWDRRQDQSIRLAIKDLDKEDPEILAKKVKRFFTLYARNRHKQTVLTPALHSETYSPDDNRFDHRQFLFDAQWTWQFREIDKKVEEIKRQDTKKS